MDNDIKTEMPSPGRGKNTVNVLTEDLRHVSIIGKPRQFVHGDNFFQFCERFTEYVSINELKKNLDLIFLSLVDNRTHASLKTVALEDEVKVDPVKLCAAFKNAINPDVGN